MQKKECIHLFISVLIFTTLKIFLPTDSGLTPSGASAMALFIAVLYSWLTISIDWTSFLALGLLVLTGIATHSQIWAASWGGFITILVMSVTILNAAVNECGIAQRIALWFITRKCVEGRPYVFFTLFMLSIFVIGCFMDSVPLGIMFCLMAQTIIKELGYKSRDKFATILVLSILWVASISYGSTPIGHPVVLVLLGIMEKMLGESISFFKYMLVGVPYGLLATLGGVLIIKFLIRPDCSKFSAFDVAKKKQELVPLTKEAKITGIVYLIVVFCWLFPDLFGWMLPKTAGYVKSMGAAVPPILGIGVLSIIKIKGKPLLSIAEATRKMPWVTVIFCATTLAFSAAITMDGGGVNVFLINIMEPLAANMSLEIILVVAIIISIVVTNFISNAVTGMLVMATFIPVLSLTNNSLEFLIAAGVMVTISAQLDSLTPSGTVVAPVIFNSGYVTVLDGLRYGSLMMIYNIILVLLVVRPLALIVF